MNWRRALIAPAVALPVIGLLTWGMTLDPKYIPSPLPGRDAPTFALEVFATGEAPLQRPLGDTIALDRLRGKVVVVNFWASWCLACRDEHEDLSRSARQYANAPVEFVGVTYQDRRAAALEWIEQMGGQAYPSVDDPRARTAIDYGLYGVPETFIVDQGGRVAHKQTGPITQAILTRIVDSLLAGRPAEVK